MEEVPTWINAAWIIGGAVIVIAGVIVKLTKTKKDDAVFAKVKELWDKLSPKSKK